MTSLTIARAGPRGRSLTLVVPAMLLIAALAAGCVSTPQPSDPPRPTVDPNVAAMYGPVEDHDYTVPAIDVSQVDPKYLRQIVDYHGGQRPGTVVVDPYHKFLYLVMEHGKAMRYGVGVARAGMQFQGSATIARKAAWPHWTPTPDMIKRDPDLYEPLADGMDGGLKNPLGARALYLFRDGKDTLYRLHGTNQPWSIGKNVSSGCIRLFNQDILDLYRRVPKGAKVVVLGPNDPSPSLPETGES